MAGGHLLNVGEGRLHVDARRGLTVDHMQWLEATSVAVQAGERTAAVGTRRSELDVLDVGQVDRSGPHKHARERVARVSRLVQLMQTAGRVQGAAGEDVAAGQPQQWIGVQVGLGQHGVRDDIDAAVTEGGGALAAAAHRGRRAQLATDRWASVTARKRPVAALGARQPRAGCAAGHRTCSEVRARPRARHGARRARLVAHSCPWAAACTAAGTGCRRARGDVATDIVQASQYTPNTGQR